MKLLVTGGAGYIGSVVAEAALASGHEVVVLDDLRAGHRDAIPHGCTFVEGSIGDSDVLNRLFTKATIDAVLHLAAEAAIAPSITDPAVYFQANLTEALVLLDAMRAYGVRRMIFSSTAATYGEPLSLPIQEDHPQQPINAYGESKLMFETCLRWYQRAYDMRTIGFRYFNAAGATARCGERRQHETHLLPLALDAAGGCGPRLRVFGTDLPTPDGTCVRDYVHVSDIAKAHLLALAHVDRLRCRFFNIGTGIGFSVKQVIETVERVTGRAVPWEAAARRAGDPAVLVAASQRIREELGWYPDQPGLESIVRTAWQWRRRIAEAGRADLQAAR